MSKEVQLLIQFDKNSWNRSEDNVDDGTHERTRKYSTGARTVPVLGKETIAVSTVPFLQDIP